MKYARIDPFYTTPKPNSRPPGDVWEEHENTFERLLRFAKEMSEYDCQYPEDYCLGVHPADLGHGMCNGCQAREALLECGEILDFDGIEMIEGDE